MFPYNTRWKFAYRFILNFYELFTYFKIIIKTIIITVDNCEYELSREKIVQITESCNKICRKSKLKTKTRY